MSLVILDNLARMYRAFGRSAEAVALAEQVRDMRVMLLGALHPDTIYTLHNLGSAYNADGQTEKALAMYQRAAAGLEKREFAHAAARQIVHDLSDLLDQHGQSEQADVWRQKWLVAVKTREGPSSPAYTNALAQLGGDLVQSKQYDKAEPILRECAALVRTHQPEDLTRSLVESWLGTVLLEQKKYADAEPLLLKGYEGIKARQAQMPPLYARFRVNEAGQRIVQLYEAWNRPEDAAEWRAKLQTPRPDQSKPSSSGAAPHSAPSQGGTAKPHGGR
jgi:tetratricopeptide (TPR) repeat protein